MKLAHVCSRRNVLSATLVLLLGGVAAHGQQPPRGGGGNPLLIDFTAVTADGKAVADLTAADIAIRIGGKARTISSLELKKIQPAAAAAPAAGAPAPEAGDITPPFSTNEAKAASATPARSFLIVVDTDSLVPSAESAVKSSIEGLLKGLTNADRVALSTLPRDTAQVGFGTGMTRVREAVAALKGQKLASVSAADALCRTSQTLDGLKSLLQPLATNDSPTSVIFIVGSLSMPDKQTGTAGTCEVVQPQYQAVADMAAESRVNMYVVQGDPGVMGRDPGMDSLAGVTGAGQVMRTSGDGFAPRVLDAASTYWVATVASDPTDRPGQAQRLDVKANRDGVTVHARAFAAPSRTAMAGAAAPAKSGTVSPKDMIATDAKFNDLQLRAATYFARGQADKMTVMVMAEPVDPTVKITAMRVGFFDQANKGASLDAPQIATYPITTVLPVGVGQYRIRVAATDASGKSGAVDVMVNTTLATAGPLKLGALLLGAPTEKGMSPRLRFSTEEKIMAYLEMYGQITGGISVKFELAKSDTGPAINTLPATGGGPTNEPDKFQINGEMPIAKLEPGDYVLRAVVQMEGQPEGKVLRTFRKMAK